MKLRHIIDHYFGGNRKAFSKAANVTPQTVSRWLFSGAVVSTGMICLPSRELPPLPEGIERHDFREVFEERMKETWPDMDLSSIDGVYLDNDVHNIYLGWYLAQMNEEYYALSNDLGY